MFWIVARLWEVVASEIGLLIKVNQFFLKWRVLLFCSDPVLGQLTQQIRLGTRYVYPFTPLCISTCEENARL